MKSMGTATVTASKGVKLPEDLGKPKKRSKFGNKITEVNGIKFHSKKESKRWPILQLLEKADQIGNLRRQVRYDFYVNLTLVGWYTADFVYDDLTRGGMEVVEDVKSEATRKDEAYRIRKRLMKAIHGIDIREV